MTKKIKLFSSNVWRNNDTEFENFKRWSPNKLVISDVEAWSYFKSKKLICMKILNFYQEWGLELYNLLQFIEVTAFSWILYNTKNCQIKIDLKIVDRIFKKNSTSRNKLIQFFVWIQFYNHSGFTYILNMYIHNEEGKFRIYHIQKIFFELNVLLKKNNRNNFIMKGFFDKFYYSF